MQFKSPPAERRRQRSPHWEEAVKELKSKPGEWGMVGVYSPGIATHLRKGKYPSFIPEGMYADDPLAAERYMKQHWEITTRRINEGRRNEVYIRWVGSGQA